MRLTNRVAGVTVGDPVTAIDWSLAVNVTSDVPDTRRGFSSGGVFIRRADGTDVEVPREQLISEVAGFGGRVYTTHSTLEVRDGRVSRLWLRGDDLSGLPWKAEKDLADLGTPSGIELSFGRRTLHFPQHELSVAWNARSKCLESVALGPVEWRPRVFTARDVIEAWSATDRWEEPEERGSLRWVRWAQVRALFQAFDLGLPQDFKDGDFIVKRAAEYPLARFAMSRAPNGTSSFRGMFRTLLRYRQRAHSLFIFNANVLEAGDAGFAAAIDLTEQANDSVRSALERIDLILCELIAPDGRTFNEETMINTYGWPHVDVDQLEVDEL